MIRFLSYIWSAIRYHFLRYRWCTRKSIIVIIFTNLLVLVGCASEPPAVIERSQDEIYNKAITALRAGQYKQAAKEFQDFERQHPYSPWVRRSYIMAAYSHYLDEDYDSAIETSRNFIKLFPSNRDAPYAQYLIAISYYEQITDVGRDQSNTERAVNALNTVVKRYPSTDYARDAALKLDLARDHLAGKEMEIGRFYLNKDQPAAAINRFRYVLENYGTTNHVPEALYRLTEAHLTLGINREAQTAAAILGHNFVGNKWYERSYALLTGKNLKPVKDDRSWIAKIWDAIF